MKVNAGNSWPCSLKCNVVVDLGVFKYAVVIKRYMGKLKNFHREMYLWDVTVVYCAY